MTGKTQVETKGSEFVLTREFDAPRAPEGWSQSFEKLDALLAKAPA